MESVLLKIEECIEHFVNNIADKRLVLSACSTDFCHFLCNNGNQLRKFALSIHMLANIYDLILKDAFCTKREIYYQNKELYESQRALNLVITQLCNVLNEPRINLHIISTAKSLVFGHLSFREKDDTVINCSQCKTGLVIPNFVELFHNFVCDARFILIVEKDATFQKLLEEKFCQKFGSILITGKGYPDISTRKFVRRLTEDLKLPAYCLTDSGAHGIEIMLNYKYGPKVRAAESSSCAASNIIWLGVYPSEIEKYNIPADFQQSVNDRELRKVYRLLLREDIIQNEPLLKKELEVLKETRKKVEIQNMAHQGGPSYLTNVYLANKIINIENNVVKR